MNERILTVPDDETRRETVARESEYDAWFRREIQRGLDSARAGRLIRGAEVEAKFAAKRAATRRRIGLGKLGLAE